MPKRKTQASKPKEKGPKTRRQTKTSPNQAGSTTELPITTSANHETTGMPMVSTSLAMATGMPSAMASMQQQGSSFPIIQTPMQQLPTQIQGEHFEDPIPIATYADQGIFVNEATKNKIWNGEYIDLAVLLRQNFCPSATDNSGTLTVVNNQITIKQSGTKIKVPINSIQNWTDAFINFIIIFSLKHKDKATILLKYLALIRGAAANNPIHKWLAYDTQFRLRMSNDPSKNWTNIDGHLWLSCGLSGDLTAVAQSAAPCYEYNYKGFCSRLTCTYAHTCIKCKVAHPACTCSMYLESRNMNTNRTYNATQPAPFQSLGYGHNRPNMVLRPFQLAGPPQSYAPRPQQRMLRPQLPRSYIAPRPNFRAQTRFMGPRPHTY